MKSNRIFPFLGTDGANSLPDVNRRQRESVPRRQSWRIQFAPLRQGTRLSVDVEWLLRRN